MSGRALITRDELEALAATSAGLDRVPEPLRPLALRMARAGVVNALRAGDRRMRAALQAHRARRAEAQRAETPQPPAQPSKPPTRPAAAPDPRPEGGRCSWEAALLSAMACPLRATTGDASAAPGRAGRG